MSEDKFAENVYVPISLDNYTEYALPEGDAVEKAQAATHELRTKKASLQELYDQLEEKKAEIEFAMGRILPHIGG